jgi:hypothetical protein
MAIERGGYALSGETGDNDDQMTVWSDFEEQKNERGN